MAQLAEQLICNQQVIGSSPIIGFYTISYCIYGQIPEWPKGTDCKSAATCFGGSNPPLPIKMTLRGHLFVFNFISRDGAVWKLAGLITRRSQVQILFPQLRTVFVGIWFFFVIRRDPRSGRIPYDLCRCATKSHFMYLQPICHKEAHNGYN